MAMQAIAASKVVAKRKMPARMTALGAKRLTAPKIAEAVLRRKMARRTTVRTGQGPRIAMPAAAATATVATTVVATATRSRVRRMMARRLRARDRRRAEWQWSANEEVYPSYDSIIRLD